MRTFFLASFVMVAMVALAAPGFALERTQIRDDGQGYDGWSSASFSCAVIYYNRCTLWSWVWSGWGPFDRVGVCIDANACLPGARLEQTALRVFGSAPAVGYGFTGTVSVYPVDSNCCPVFSQQLASQAWFPGTVVNCYPNGGPWDVHNWWAYHPSRFALVYEFGPAGGGGGLPSCVAHIVTDHPAAGPTGPAACGYCYPLDRQVHTWYFGNNTTTLCPGSTLNDGVCDAELRAEY
jgi:hypothetical protein